MLRNFIITSLRILWRNKVVSAINILSLSIGITAFILILLYVHHETSYDKFNENYDRIYRLEGDHYQRLPTLIGDQLRDKIPEIEHMTLIQTSRIQNFINIDEKDPAKSALIRTQVIRADSAIFNIFTFPFIQGDPKTALNDPFTVVLTESTAKKLFGSTNPIGETIHLENQMKSDNEYLVTGVIRDVANSHINIDALISLRTVQEFDIQNDFNYNPSDRFWNGIYLLLRGDASPTLASKKINDLLAEVNDGNQIKIVFKKFHLQPMKDLYLYSEATELQFGKKGNGDLLWSFLAIAIFVLLLAIINYVNLTTARSILRAKEVIIKKVMGSSRSLLRQQFIAESIVITLISFLLALTAIQLLIPKFNQLVMANINLLEFNTPTHWIIILAAILFTGFISGIYPAMALTSFRSVANVKGPSVSGAHGILFRRLLLTFQFSISILLIVGIITNLQQLEFVKHSDPGFNKEHVLLIPTPNGFPEASLKRQTLRDRYIAYPNIRKVTFTNKRFGTQQPSNGDILEINGSIHTAQFLRVDPDFMDVMEIEVIEGRNFSWDQNSGQGFPWGDAFTALINETAAQKYWSDSPVGKFFNFRGQTRNVKTQIIGIVEDSHFRSMHHKVEPLIYFRRGVSYPPDMRVKISPENISETINLMKKEWREVYGAEPFDYAFLDEVYEQHYISDERAAKIIGYFTILAITIACMGLFALSSFMAVQRTKEIGIRKTLGASSTTIFVMLSREYIKWILLSALIASPIAWYSMNKWLETFAYRIELGPGVFILAAVLALAIGLITVGWQALKSAVANPVEALRYE